MKSLLKLLVIIIALLKGTEVSAQSDLTKRGFLYARRDSAYMHYVDSIAEHKSKELGGVKVLAKVNFYMKSQETYFIWMDKNTFKILYLSSNLSDFPERKWKLRLKRFPISRDTTFEPIRNYLESNELIFQNFLKDCTEDEVNGGFSDTYQFSYFASFQNSVKIESVYYPFLCVNHTFKTQSLINSIGKLTLKNSF